MLRNNRLVRVFLLLAVGWGLFSCSTSDNTNADAKNGDNIPVPSNSETPSTPTILEAITVSTSEIWLNWWISPREDGFKLERKVGIDGTYAELATFPFDKFTYYDTGLSADTTYYYRVQAVRIFDGSFSPYSSEIGVATAKSPNPFWARSYSGSHNATAYSINPTSDAGYAVAGHISLDSVGGATSDYAWVLKLDANGATKWQYAYTNNGADVGDAIQQTSDGGYIISGRNIYFGRFWVRKLDADGLVSWQKQYETNGFYGKTSIKQTADNSYILIGTSTQPTELFILKLNGDGNVNWYDYPLSLLGNGIVGGGANDLAITTSGGFVIAGYMAYADSSSDFWVKQLDTNGERVWEKTYGQTGADHATSIIQTDDDNDGNANDGFIVAGYTDSNSDPTQVNYALWVLKLDAAGDIEWQKSYSGGGLYFSIRQTANSDYLIAGSQGGDVWVLHLDSNGEIVWQKSYGATPNESANAIEVTLDGGFVTAGLLRGASDSSGVLDAMLVLKSDANGNMGDDSYNNIYADIRVHDTSAAATVTTVAPVTRTYYRPMPALGYTPLNYETRVVETTATIRRFVP